MHHLSPHSLWTSHFTSSLHPLYTFFLKSTSLHLCAPPLKPLTLTLSAPPVWTLSLNGWEDIYKGRYRLKNRECSMGNSSNQSLSGPLLHHSVYLLSTFFLWTCRTISLPFLLHWHTCSALRGTKRTKSTFAYGVWGCHNHVTFSCTGCPKTLGPLCFCHFFGFWSPYRRTSGL
jgi:hypothetical protein